MTDSHPAPTPPVPYPTRTLPLGARRFYCGVLGMTDETDLRPLKLPFPGLFLRCGEQQALPLG